MPQATPIPVPAAKTARTVAPVRIFTVGERLPSGRIADEAFVDQAIRNWQQHQAKGDPRFPKPPAYLIPAASVSLGHHDNSSIAQAYAERSDLPAVGWPAGRLYRQGPHLYAERFEGVPVGLAAWVNSGNIPHVSSEFYENYRGLGPCLRRVAMLGADVPACKDLGPIPTMVYDPEKEVRHNPLAFSERLAQFAGKHRRFGVSLAGTGLVTFSESNPERPMNLTPQQQAILDALTAAGVDVSKLDGAALDAIAAACAAPVTQPAPAAVPAVNAEGDKCPPGTDPTKDPAKMAAMYTEIVAKAVAGAVGPLQAQVKQLNEIATASASKLTAAEAERDRAEIAAFCETNRDRIFPFELDPKVGVPLPARLLALPTATVATFAEGKLSPRAAEMAAIAARPPIAKFAEKIKQAGIGQADDAAARRRRMLEATPNGQTILAREAAAAAK